MTERYEIIKLIGKDPAGGMYLAEDTTLERKVVFRHIDFSNSGERAEQWSKDFSRYSGKLCTLQHPNLLTIYDIDIDEDGANIVTQFIEAETLAKRLEQGPLTQENAYKMAGDLLEALHAAHASGLYHGALHTGSVKCLPRASGGYRHLIVDLGLNNLATMIKGQDINIADHVLLAPELKDESYQPDARADLFMLGQLCYSALAGGHPFSGYTPERCAEAYLAGELPPLNHYASDVQADFGAWIMQLANGDQNQRPASAEEAMISLQNINLDESPVEAPKVVETPPVKIDSVAKQPQKPLTPAWQPTEKKSNKVAYAIMVMLCLLIGLGLWLVLKRSGKEVAENSIQEAAPPVIEGELVQLGSSKVVNLIANSKSPVTVNLDTKKTLDWKVNISTGASNEMKEKEGGNYISSISHRGDFTEAISGNNLIKFTANGEVITPNMVVKSNGAKNVKLGEGWQVILRIPKKHRGPLIVTFYMTQVLCDFDIQIAYPGQKEPVKLTVPHSKSGVVRIPIQLNDPKAGDFYTLNILAASQHPEEAFTMGINAIHIERR